MTTYYLISKEQKEKNLNLIKGELFVLSGLKLRDMEILNTMSQKVLTHIINTTPLNKEWKFMNLVIETKHISIIGSLTEGYCFKLDIGGSAKSLQNWVKLFNITGNIIADEHGNILTPDEMTLIIDGPKNPKIPPTRHQIDGNFCVGHGAGYYDYILDK